MTRFINSILIAVICFFAFLAVFGYFGSDRPTAQASDLSIGEPTASWGDSDEDGTRLLLTLPVRNRGHLDGQLTLVSYQVERDGVKLGEASQDPGVRVPAESTLPLQLAIDLPPDFATDWWTAYTTSDERSSLRVSGAVTARGATEAPIPFAWSQEWQGNLSSLVAGPAANCDGPAGNGTLCLDETHADWTASGLALQFDLRNVDSDPVGVRNATASLWFAGDRVALGSAPSPVQIGQGDEGRLRIVASFPSSSVAGWWPEHVDRCERSSATLALDLSIVVERAGGDAGPSTEVQEIHWTFPVGEFRSGFVCNGGA